MEEVIKQFLAVGSGDGSGSGYGYGYGDDRLKKCNRK